MSQSTNWKAAVVGAACGIALLEAVRALILPIYILAASGSLNPMGVVSAPAAVRLTYINLGLGLLCVGVGGFVAARFANARYVFHGFLAGVGMALVRHANLVFEPGIHLGAVALVALTVAFGAAGGYIATHMKT
jgi:hypothetical protein